MLSEEEDGWEADRAVVPVEDLFVAAEREGFLAKTEKKKILVAENNGDALLTSVFYGNVGEDTSAIVEEADALVKEIEETLGETNVIQQQPAYAGELCAPPSVFDEDGGRGWVTIQDQTIESSPLSIPGPSTSRQISSISLPNSIDLKLQDLNRNDPDFIPLSEDEDSDTSDLISVPGRELSIAVAAIEEPSCLEIAVPLRKRMSRGQKKKCDRRGESRAQREKGEVYLGYRRVKNPEVNKEIPIKMAHDTPRRAKQMEPPCDSEKCKKWTTRLCSSVSESERAELFTLFWKNMNWDTKKMFVCSLVDIKQKNSEQRIDDGKKSRRSLTFVYHLKIGARKVQVCKKMFLSTFGLGEMSVRHWLNNFNDSSVPHSKNPAGQGLQQCETLSEDENPRPQRKPREGLIIAERYLREYLDALPKLPSHYMRKDSQKLYLEADFASVSQLYRLYLQKCTEDGQPFVSRNKFDKTYKAMNIGVFNPRKDQCDVCCGFKNGHVSADVHERHITCKEQARKQKELDKERAIAGEVHVITVDMMAVQLMSRLLASSSYYKLKLHVHNYTIYNLGNRDVKCYWWDETVGSLDASTYASCLVDYIEELMETSPKKDVIIFSDGCPPQNRNNVLSNALLHTSMKHNITITQKILEKGHTQMEVDSVHSHIEGKMGKSEMYLPHHFILKTVEARIQGTPYRAVYLEPGFFLDYAVQDKTIYSSIRPGNTKGDPVVLDLRWIQYESHGEIKFKCNYDDELQSLPRRPRLKHDHNFPKLFNQSRPLTFDQYTDLSYLAENLLPKDCLQYYKGLPHEGQSIRAERKKEENIQKKKAKKSGENENGAEIPKKKVRKSTK